ncbi:MAG TPA: FlgD immunoglobulin-like domain containing protein, partial [Methylomirabilota bacterium]|nr:FlgD immunoglobulin-like domain containing protein [Methylomirabilota bacterium]
MPLGGLQGLLVCPEPFRVVDVRPAPGMDQLHVTWQQDGRGARYVVISSSLLPIPAGQPAVLQVALQADQAALPGQRGYFAAPLRVASGPDGENVPLCDGSLVDIAPIILCVTTPADSCDVNADGRADVRDLVIMTRCLRSTVPPVDSAGICRDCNHDGVFGFSDIVCCARHILRGPFLPRDSVNADDALRVSFEPQRFGDGLLVRVRVSGAEGLAGAMLRLRYPEERWRAEVPLPVPFARTSSEGWLPIVDTEEPGLVQLGGLRIAEEASGEIDFEFAILPTAPPLAGDQLVAEGADMVGGDGTVSTPSLPLPNLTLDAPGPPGDPPTGVELSAARPNPFARATSFTVSLPRESDVQLTVHDLAGREVATLANGRLPAGRRDFTWAGAGARDGVYFVRLAVDGEV